MEYYSGMKSNELLFYASIWMSLQGIILSEKTPYKIPDQDGNKKILNFSPLMNTLNVQLHMEQFPLREIQKLAE